MLKSMAKEVLEICRTGKYQIVQTDDETVEVSIGKQLEYSRKNTILYSPEEQISLRENISEGAPFEISVIDGTTQMVAKKLSEEGDVCLLNFASARNPGGGFLNGSKAQEEDLCRCSGLYPLIEKQRTYYDSNRNQPSLLYTDYLIFCPKVPFFKVKSSGQYLEEPFYASVITSPAPNTKPYLENGGNLEELESSFQRRWENVLTVASKHKVKTLILGAWGCGAFGGDPDLAADTALRAISRYGELFHRIVFAIPSKGKVSKKNLEVFRTKIFE